MDLTSNPICNYRGCIAYCPLENSEFTNTIYSILERYNISTSHSSLMIPREWHVTLFTKEERQKLSEDIIQESKRLSIARCFPIDLGGQFYQLEKDQITIINGVVFILCIWPQAQKFRLRHGFPLQPFHVTLSCQNNHTLNKFIPPLTSLQYLSELSYPAMEALCRELLLQDRIVEAFDVAIQLCQRYQCHQEISEIEVRGWSGLGDAAFRLSHFKLAMLSFALCILALDSCISQHESNIILHPDVLKKHCLHYMKICSKYTEWGPVATTDELEQIPKLLRHRLLTPWPMSLREYIVRSAEQTQLIMESRTKLNVQHRIPNLINSKDFQIFSLPRFFRWIVPYRLAVMSTPRNSEDIAHLSYALNITHIVTLTEEEPLPELWFERQGNLCMKNTFLPVSNYKAPSLEQIDLFIQICAAVDVLNPSVLVHCGGGKGRAGTMIACYLVAFGYQPISANLIRQWEYPHMTAKEAINSLRVIRPGSIETSEQENAISAYASLLWKRRSLFPISVEEPPISKPLVFGNQEIQKSDFLMLCGIPGSGKSTFCQILCKRNTRMNRNHHVHCDWRILDSDYIGRSGLERTLGLNSTKTILDRCNGNPTDRREFLALTKNWSQHATAIWFKFSPQLCLYRAQQRINHPTLRPGKRVATAIAQHDHEFQQPELSEGFKSVVVVTSKEAAMSLAYMLSPPVELLKFPRTPHVFDLGAATEDDIKLPNLPTTGSQISIVITEKLDGANMGFSLDENRALVVQNRSHFVCSTSHPQFQQLDNYIEKHREFLYAILNKDDLFPERYILYGEWLAAIHSIAYTNLKSLFYAFDIYDREKQRFLPRSELEYLFHSTKEQIHLENGCPCFSIPLTPIVWEGHNLPSKAELTEMTYDQSHFYNGPREGIYIKWECASIGVKERGKVVRSNFIAGNEHWTKNKLQFNRVE